jgi:hypothetical protein
MNSHRRLITLTIALLFLITACTAVDVQTDTPAVPEDTPTAEPEDASQPSSLPPDFYSAAAEDPPIGAEQEFSTDFSIHTVPYSEIRSGGVPKDGLSVIDNPQFVSVVEADQWIEDPEPVTVLDVNGDVRIYPYQILIFHEIANDIVGGQPVAITYCPLCNTLIVFDSTVNGMQLDFGTTGRLRFANLIMYDRQTESWWQQAGGDAIAGELTGERLTLLPASTLSWSEARDAFPEAKVLSRDTGAVLRDGTPFTNIYGLNSYEGYDNINSSPSLYIGPPIPGELPPMARVTTVELNGEAVAYPNDTLMEVGVINDTIAGTDVVVFWQSGVVSALDTEILADGQDVGTSGVFERKLAGQTLTFVSDGDTITDEQTGSTWNILGQATDGELTGEELTPVVKVDHFWFSWAAFRPDTRIYQG